jgi:hypothetical protein
MTSLDGPGFSITLLKATPEMVKYIDQPTTAVGWTAPVFSSAAWESRFAKQCTRKEMASTNGVKEQVVDGESLRKQDIT